MPRFIGWLPTGQYDINVFFELVPVSSTDVVYDLGSGDGILLFAALEKGAGRCVGVEIDHDKNEIAKETAKAKGLTEKVKFIEADFTEVDISEATVVFCYLSGNALLALRPKFEKELKPGARVVMESFSMPGWKPALIKEANARKFFLYVLPAEKTDIVYGPVF